jgi:hypothetical protein
MTLLDAYRRDAQLGASQRFVDDHCRGLSHGDRLASVSSQGCYAFGMPEQVLMVGEQPVRIGRGGIGLADAADGKLQDFGCPALFSRVRVTTLEPPSDAAPGVKARHFVELFAWTVRQPSNGAPQYLLEWRAHEVLANAIVPCSWEGVEIATRWPRPAAPPDLDQRVTLEIIRSGHVRWRIAGAPPKRGWFTLPDDKESR